MNILVAVVVLVGALVISGAGVLDAADAPGRQQARVLMTGEDSESEGEAATTTESDDDDDDTVWVQLLVLGIVIATVFVIGTAAFGLRWKLGRTEYTPPPDDGHH